MQNQVGQWPLIKESLLEALKKMTPKAQISNPVMFVAYMGAVVATIYVALGFVRGTFSHYEAQIALWIWLTVYFAKFAESSAEWKGKEQAARLRRVKGDRDARKLDGKVERRVPASSLKQGDIVICEAGDLIPADGTVIEGVASVDESAITGESAPVIRESGGDRSAVTGGTVVLGDRLIIEVTAELGKSFIDEMIELIEGFKLMKTPTELIGQVVLSSFTLVFLIVAFSLAFFSEYSGKKVSVPVLIGFLVCMIPTTKSALLRSVGIAGMDRLVRNNVIAKSARAIEVAGDVDLLIIDKTGTITVGNRVACEMIPFGGLSEKEFAEIAQEASLSDETFEGRSIVGFAKDRFGLKGEGIDFKHAKYIPFSPKTRMSGLDILGGERKVVRTIRKGASDVIQKHVESLGGAFPAGLEGIIEKIAKTGGTPLVVADQNKVAGVVHLKDMIKGGAERFEEFRKMGIQTLMVTGDSSLAAAAIAAKTGIDDYLAPATPEMKMDLIKQEQAKGRVVAMAGDGTNDAPALAQADVGIAMNTGTQTSREAGNMVDLDSNPIKLFDIVEVGKELLMTKGALTVFSLVSSCAISFAIIPALFAPRSSLNWIHLHSPRSAILSAVIYNALIILAFVPIAIRGVKYSPWPVERILLNNMLVFGLGGMLVSFAGIKLIDKIIKLLGVA